MKKHRKVYYKCLAGKRKSIERELPTKVYKIKSRISQCLNQEVWEALLWIEGVVLQTSIHTVGYKISGGPLCKEKQLLGQITAAEWSCCAAGSKNNSNNKTLHCPCIAATTKPQNGQNTGGSYFQCDGNPPLHRLPKGPSISFDDLTPHRRDVLLGKVVKPNWSN